ncbi:MAG TPA: hypothetical protein VNO33_00730 [Kofleriaceae bacterium]|nr:hypothetical protein [Kofleriaceae bacterium]
MGIFDKLGKKAVPEWASFMSGEEFDRFIELTEDDLRGRGARFARKDGVIAVAARGASALPPGNYRLGSLAQMCHQMEQSEWPVGIARHFDMAIQGVDAAEELSAIAHDYGRVKPLLRVRIYPPGWTQSKEGLLVRHDIPGLDTVLCFDLPTMVFPASRVYSARWGVSVEAAFEDGIANSTELDEIQKEDIPIAGMELKGFVGQPVWHTTHALKLEQLAGPAGQYGALVGLPNRHVILVHNITDGDMPGRRHGPPDSRPLRGGTGFPQLGSVLAYRRRLRAHPRRDLHTRNASGHAGSDVRRARDATARLRDGEVEVEDAAPVTRAQGGRRRTDAAGASVSPRRCDPARVSLW